MNKLLKALHRFLTPRFTSNGTHNAATRQANAVVARRASRQPFDLPEYERIETIDGRRFSGKAHPIDCEYEVMRALSRIL
ncbi:MAG: hypothetical protein R3E87_24605 [Burkholderiaceae bacterium]